MRLLIVLTALAGLFAISGCGEGSVSDSADSANESPTVAQPVASHSEESADFAMPDDEFPIGLAEGEGAEAPAPGSKVAMKAGRGTDEDFGGESMPSPPSRQKQIQSGTLTAGSLDDHDRYGEFLDYVNTARQRASGQTLSSFDGRRIPIKVVTPQGAPVAHAKVTIAVIEPPSDGGPDEIELRYPAGQQPPRRLVTLHTGTDGRASLVPSLDGAGSATKFEISVETAAGTTATLIESIEHGEWTVEVDEARRPLPQKLDLALVIDTTGSMGDELEYLKVEIDSIAARIKRLFPDVDQRFALILYRDNGDEYVTRTFDFTGSISDFRNQLARQQANGGGDYPEAMQEALRQTNELSWRDGSAARVAFLVGDAPPHTQHFDQTLESVMQLRRKEVTLFPIAASGVRREAEYLMRISAFLTMGQYLFLTDHSGVGNSHAKPTTPKYTVERLDQLMVRMVTTELAGEPVLPRDIIAIEETGGPFVPPGQLPEQAAAKCEVMPEEITLNCGPPIGLLVGTYGRPIFGIACLVTLAFLEFRFARRA